MGSIDLGVCEVCAFIQNSAFDQGDIDYTKPYEDSQAASPTFRAFAIETARMLDERFSLQNKRIFEVGCGKAEWLALVCRDLNSHGLAIDPAYVPGRAEAADEARLEVIVDFFDESKTDLTGDLVVCRHTLEHIRDARWHAKRGSDAMNAMGILKHFSGTLCHDHWKPYFTYNCSHSLCNAHHIRELERAWEQDNQKWAKNMQDLLIEINDAVDQAGGSLSKKIAKNFRSRYRNILTRGGRECPAPEQKAGQKKRGRVAKSKSRNLLERMREFETETLRFMTDKRIPFTNNQGENDIRMTKVQQKISGCFRSFEGAEIFCLVRSYITTCRKNDIAPTKALRILFSGSLPDFLVKLE